MLRKLLVALTLITGIIAGDKVPVTVEYGGVKTTFASLEDLHLWEAIVAGDVAGVEAQLKLGASAIGTSRSVILASGQATEDALLPSFVTCMRYGDVVALRMFKAFVKHGFGPQEGFISIDGMPQHPIDAHVEQFVKEGSQSLKPKGPMICPKSVKFLKDMIDKAGRKTPC